MSGPTSKQPVVFSVTDLCRRDNKWCDGKDSIFHVTMPKQTSWKIIADNVNATAVYTKYKMVACPVKGNIKLQIIKGSTKHKLGVRPFNHRYGVKSIHVQQGGKLKKMRRGAGNIFWYKSRRPTKQDSVTLVLTSSRNRKIQHVLEKVEAGIVETKQNFPLSDKKTGRCMPFVDQIIYSDGLATGVAGKQVAQDWRILNQKNVEIDLKSKITKPRTGHTAISAKFAKDGTFSLGTASVTSTETLRGIRFYTKFAGNATFFLIGQDGKPSKAMPIAQGNSTLWNKQFFEFSDYIPQWKGFKGFGFSGSALSLYIDDIWLYLKNNVKVKSKSDSVMTMNE
jgi:hypothetical protein